MVFYNLQHDYPHPSMVDARVRDMYKRHRDEATQMGDIIEDNLHDHTSNVMHQIEGYVIEHMIDDLYQIRGRRALDNRDDTLDIDNETTFAASTPICGGSGFSILRFSLEILNIQTSHGWRNASVDNLLQY